MKLKRNRPTIAIIPRMRWDALFVVAAPLTLAAAAIRGSFTGDWLPLIAAPCGVVLFWAFMRGLTPSKGLPAITFAPRPMQWMLRHGMLSIGAVVVWMFFVHPTLPGPIIFDKLVALDCGFLICVFAQQLLGNVLVSKLFSTELAAAESRLRRSDR